MKENQFKRLISLVLVIAMVISLCPTIALAGDTLPYQGESALGENEPTSHGYRAEDLLSWDPATDPDAELLRARVPLQERIDPVAATQANPSLNPEVEYLTLAGDYGNAFFGGTSYTNEFSEYCFNFWQYIDYYGPWHGQTTATTPIELWDADGERAGTSNWEKRTFEFGMMNLPNAAYTNAAHKNGVLSLGCIFLPRAYQSWRTLIQRDEDGGFPYADKLIEITKYYGFDGWFVNLEGSDSPSGDAKKELAAFLKYLRDEGGLYIQYYNAGGSIDQEMMDLGAADSFFKDYGWSTSGAITEVEKYGIAAVHGGFEAGGNRWNNTFSKMWSNDEVVCSIATLGTDFVHAGLDEDFGNYLETRRENDEFQWMSAVRERAWFTGSSGDPTDSTLVTDAETGVGKTNGSGTNKMPGIASMITERSVINGDTFYTNFNTGHGLVYAIDGQISNDHEWANISIQDILPTWQFWFETEGTALKAEYDYGTKYKKALDAEWNKGVVVEDSTTYGEFDFDLVDPYNGGSSLAIYGPVDANNFMHLYKTNLDVTADTKVNITFKKTSTDNVAMSLGVVLTKDIDAETDTYTVTELPIENTTAASEGWVTATVDLSAYAGESVAMLGLYFKGEAEDYQMHIGQIEYLSGRSLTPDAPTGLAVAKAYDTNEMVVTWDLESYDSVKQYNVYAVINGVEQYMGGIYDEIYYIKNVYDAQGAVTIKVTAVGADGSESEAATAVYDYSKAVTGLSVEAADGTLTVNFTPADTGAATDVTVYVPATKATYTATAAAGETSVVVTVPTGADADGKEYEMQVTPVGGSTKAYDGKLDDCYCIPYDAPMTDAKLTSPVACTDWYKLYLVYSTESGASGSTEYVRGTKSHGELNNDWSKFQALPSDVSTLTVTLTDYTGNVSEPVSYLFVNGQPVDPNQDYPDDLFPDAGLRKAVREQIGTTYAELLAYTGPLDLTDKNVKSLEGLTMISGITELTLTGTAVTEITSNMIPGSTTKLDLSDCLDLKSVELANWPDLELDITGCSSLESLNWNGTNATSLDLTGCGKVQDLYLANSKLTALDITALTKLHNFNISGSCIDTLTAADAGAYTNAYRWAWDNSLMDLSDATSEGALKNGISTYFATADIPDEVSKDETQMGSGYMSYWGGQSITINLGKVALLSTVSISNPYTQWYDTLTHVTIEVSQDNVTFTQVAEQTEGESDSTILLPEGTKAQYVRITNVDSAECYARVIVYGHEVAPKGFTYGGQKPAVIRDDVKGMTVPADNTTYQLKDLLDESYASTRTLKGNLLSDMAEADWIDAAYLAAQGTAPKGVKVAITNSKGQDYVAEVEGPSLGDLDTANNLGLTATVLAQSGYGSLTATQGPVRLFDGTNNYSENKWCISGQSVWVGFALEEPAIVGQWDVYTAVGENENYIASAFRLQVLNPEAGITEEDFLALSSSQQKSLFSDASYWKDLSDVTGNTQTYVSSDVPNENLAKAQVYRLYVDQSQQMSFYGWAVRMNELELYGYTGEIGADTNGVLVADTVDTYTVSYTKSKVEIANTVVVVRAPSVEEVIALIDAIGTPVTVDSKAAIKAARTAYENLPEDQKALVTNYETLTDAEAAYLALADAVEALIDEIGFVTLDSKDAIEAARAAYDALTEDLKVLVANYETLLKAEQAYAYLTEVDDLVKEAEAAKADAEAAKADAEAAQAAAEAAQAAAEAAQAAAEAAKAEAVAAQAAAEQAAAEAGEDRAAAEAAMEKAQEAQGKAEDAQEAAEEAQAKAEDAQKAAEEARDAAVAAQEAAEAAADAAENSRQEAAAEAAKAAAEAAKAAEEAKNAAQSSAAAADSAKEAAEAAQEAAGFAAAAAEAAQAAQAAQADAEAAQAAAEAAQAAAEEAQEKAEAAAKTAEDAQKRAEEAEAKAEEAANSAAEDKEAAQQAAAEAKAAREAAESAQKAAEEAKAAAEAAQAKAEAAKAGAETAQKAAEEAAAAAEESNKAAAQEAAKAAEEAKNAATSAVEAAESAAQAAEYAQKAAETYAEIVNIKAELVDYLAKAQKAAEEAEEAQRKAEEAQKKAEEAALAAAKYYALIEIANLDTSSFTEEQMVLVKAAVEEAKQAVDAAETPEEVTAAMDALTEALAQAGELVCASDLFTDVKPDAWYHEGIDFMVRAEYMTGMGDGTFGVNGSVTRAQLVTILYRIAGEPSVEGMTCPFTDVADGKWYTNAIIWAANEKVVNGVTEDTFCPNQAITREQIAAILFRYSGAEAVEEDVLAGFVDNASVSGYAEDAMNWAVSQGLIAGIANNGVTTLSPKATATRAQIAVILMRYLTKG